MFKLLVLFFSGLGVLTILNASCASSQPAPTPTASLLEMDYPLALNNTWVYQATRYEGVPITEIMTAIRVITETVVEVKNMSPYFVAKIHRDESAEIPVVVPPMRQDESARPAASMDFWVVASGNRLYRQEKKLDPSRLYETAALELELPLQVGKKWNRFDGGILRQVVKGGTVTVPAGDFSNCFLFDDAWAGTSWETWFCPGVGIVEEKSDHHGTPMGWHQVLVRYQLNK